jgi:hypothetical protein
MSSYWLVQILIRCALGLRGLVPPRRLTADAQLAKMYDIFSKEEDPLRKSRFLTDLHDRNETLYFRLVIEHIKETGRWAHSATAVHEGATD